MAQLPAIHLVYASDAPQHLRRLKEILQQLKAENRINTFTTWSLEDELASLREKVASGDLVLTLLTQALEYRQGEIEQFLRKIRESIPDLKIAEIIVDNIPYKNEFISFPSDLKPVRDREDMDAIWKDIERSLRDMFPVQDVASASKPTNWAKYLKLVGIFVALIVAFFIFRELFNGIGRDCIDPEKVNPEGNCLGNYDPVCGCDDKTYSNACVAANAGLKSWVEGACE